MYNQNTIANGISRVLNTNDQDFEANVYKTIKAYYGPSYEEVTDKVIEETADLVKMSGCALYPY